MQTAIAGHIESRQGYQDTASWRAVTMIGTDRRGVTIDDSAEVLYLAFDGQALISGRVPTRIAHSKTRGLIAVGCKEGPVYALAPDHGVFAVVGPHPRYVFIKVRNPHEPRSEDRCYGCGYPEDVSPADMCTQHRERRGPYRYPIGVPIRAADAAAFRGSARAFATAIGEAAPRLYRLEARRHLECYEKAFEGLSDSRDRAIVFDALVRLARAAGDGGEVRRLEDAVRALGDDAGKHLHEELSRNLKF